MDYPSDALTQLIETALAERFSSPVAELLNALPMELAVVEAGGLRVLALNPPMQSLLGHPPEAVIGRRLAEILPLSHPLADPAPYQAAASGGRPIERSIVVDQAARRCFIRPLTGGGRQVEYLLVGLVEDGGGRAAAHIARLQERNAARAEFLNMAAHELRTPLAVILGYGSLLNQGALGPEHQQLAGRRVYEKARQLSRLITDMTLLARFDELEPGLVRDPIDLPAQVGEVVREVRRAHPDLAIDLAIDADAAPTFKGNSEWIMLAVRELLDNAARFRTGPAGRVDVTLSGLPDRWLLSVADDGFGIDPAHQESLFRRFARIETEHNRHLVGLGIGLFLVRQVAQAHGGRVEVRSRPGIGSEFRLILPV